MQLLAQKVHLVEIDLLRRGEHATAPPIDLLRERVGEPEYHVSVCRFDRPGEFQVYPIAMKDSLPAIRVPLLPDAQAIVLPLQPLLDRSYDSGRFARRIDYTRSVVPPLTPEQQSWADEVLRKRA